MFSDMRALSWADNGMQVLEARARLNEALRSCQDTLAASGPALGSPRGARKSEGTRFAALETSSEDEEDREDGRDNEDEEEEEKMKMREGGESGENDGSDDDTRSGKVTRPHSHADKESRKGGAWSDDEDEQAKEDSGENGEGNWEEVTYEKHSSVKAVTSLRSREYCDYVSKLYDVYFKGSTGKNLNPVITPESQPYVSMFEACMKLHSLLAALFDERPVAVDPFGGSGLDMAAMIFNLFPKEVFINDSTWIYDKRVLAHDGGVIANNLKHMVALFSELSEGVDGQLPPKIHPPQKMDAHDFIMQMEVGMVIHILYLDPCWSLPGEKYEMSAREMANYLKANVFIPLQMRRITPRCIVLKTRWGVDHLEEVKQVLGSEYSADYCLEATPFRDIVEQEGGGILKEAKGRYRWAVFVHHSLKSVVWHQSKAYRRIFRESKAAMASGKKKRELRVWKRNFIRPNIPLYAERIKPPEMVPDELPMDKDRMMTISIPDPPRWMMHAGGHKPRR